MRRATITILATAFAAICVPVLPAATITINLLDIGTFEDYTNENISDTYTGTGFVGLYGPGEGTPAYAHLFGVEAIDYSRVILNANISALAGATINSAILSFVLVDSANPQIVNVTSFTANGTLSYGLFTPPDNLGSTSLTVGPDANQVDVTSLLAARVAANADWFGLHLAGTLDDQYAWTYTYDGGPDAAQVRLTIDYTSAVPEPSTWALMAGGTALLAFARWKRRSRS